MSVADVACALAFVVAGAGVVIAAGVIVVFLLSLMMLS